jgi:hypothetical protein
MVKVRGGTALYNFRKSGLYFDKATVVESLILAPEGREIHFVSTMLENVD